MENQLLLTRRIAPFTATFLAFLLLMIGIITGLHYCGVSFTHLSTPVVPQTIIANYTTVSAPHRKLLRREAAGVVLNRVWGDKCSKADIVINQGPTAPLPSGIPTYTVEIMNVCVTGCDIAGIHLSCGWFSSARLINPRIFKRLRYNDCLVNNGKPLANGRTLSFQDSLGSITLFGCATSNQCVTLSISCILLFLVFSITPRKLQCKCMFSFWRSKKHSGRYVCTCNILAIHADDVLYLCEAEGFTDAVSAYRETLRSCDFVILSHKDTW